MTDPLNGPRVKIKRANHDIRDVERAIDALRHHKGDGFVKEVNPETGETIFRVDLPRDTLDRISGAVGSVVDNLSRALDQTAVIFARQRLGKDPGKIYFPIFDDEAAYKSSGAQGNIRRFGADWEAFIAGLRPYGGPGGNALLYALRKAANHQHNDLIPIGTNVWTMSESQPGASFGVKVETHQWRPLYENVALMMATVNSDPQPKIETAVDVAFGDLPGIETKPVVATLHDFVGLVAGIVDAIRKTMF